MPIEEIQERADKWEPLEEHILHQGHVANTAAEDRRILLIHLANTEANLRLSDRKLQEAWAELELEREKNRREKNETA